MNSWIWVIVKQSMFSIEFVNQVKDKGLIESLEEYKASDAEGIAMVDYGFHVVMTDPFRKLVIDSLSDHGQINDAIAGFDIYYTVVSVKISGLPAFR